MLDGLLSLSMFTPYFMHLSNLPPKAEAACAYWLQVGMFALLPLFPGWLTWRARHLIWLGWKSRRWIRTKGKVVAVEDASFTIDAVRKYEPITEIRFESDRITVEYTVDGHLYRTQNDSFGGPATEPRNKHRLGHQISVFYDPQSHARAVVRKGIPGSLLALPLATLASALLLVIILWLSYFRAK